MSIEVFNRKGELLKTYNNVYVVDFIDTKKDYGYLTVTTMTSNTSICNEVK